MTPFGWWIAVYFALATVAAGAAGAAAALVFAKREGEPRHRVALLIAIAAIAAGSVALILDLERPRDFWLVLVNFNPTSWISRGSRIVPAFGLMALGLLLCGWAGAARRSMIGFAVALVLLASILAVYPAFVLGQEIGRPLWQSSLLPVLFVAGAVHIGCAMAGAPKWLELSTAAVELGLLVGYGAAIGFANLAPSTTAIALLAVAGLGVWLLPIAAISSKRLLWARVASIAIGAFAIRATILYAGQVFQ